MYICVFCIVLQCVAVCCSVSYVMRVNVIQEEFHKLVYAVVRCSALQCVAVRCYAMQCAAVSYSVLQ